MNPNDETPLRFVLDDALGSLLKWLRMLGFDTVFRRDRDRQQTMTVPSATCDILVTQSRSMQRLSAEPMIFVAPDHDVMSHLRHIMAVNRITREQVKPFSRCILCNRLTRSIEKSAVRGRVPDYVWESRKTFTECPACSRIYWRGTHAENIDQTIQKVFS